MAYQVSNYSSYLDSSPGSPKLWDLSPIQVHPGFGESEELFDGCVAPCITPPGASTPKYSCDTPTLEELLGLASVRLQAFLSGEASHGYLSESSSDESPSMDACSAEGEGESADLSLGSPSMDAYSAEVGDKSLGSPSMDPTPGFPSEDRTLGSPSMDAHSAEAGEKALGSAFMDRSRESPSMDANSAEEGEWDLDSPFMVRTPECFYKDATLRSPSMDTRSAEVGEKSDSSKYKPLNPMLYKWMEVGYEMVRVNHAKYGVKPYYAGWKDPPCPHTPPYIAGFAGKSSRRVMRRLKKVDALLRNGKPAKVVQNNCGNVFWPVGPPIMQWPIVARKITHHSDPRKKGQVYKSWAEKHLAHCQAVAYKPKQARPAWTKTTSGARVHIEKIGGEEFWVSCDLKDNVPYDLKARVPTPNHQDEGECKQKIERRLEIAIRKTQLLSQRQKLNVDEPLFNSKFKLDLNWTSVWNSKSQRYVQSDFGIYDLKGGAKRNLVPMRKKVLAKIKASQVAKRRSEPKKSVRDRFRMPPPDEIPNWRYQHKRPHTDESVGPVAKVQRTGNEEGPSCSARQEEMDLLNLVEEFMAADPVDLNNNTVDFQQVLNVQLPNEHVLQVQPQVQQVEQLQLHGQQVDQPHVQVDEQIQPCMGQAEQEQPVVQLVQQLNEQINHAKTQEYPYLNLDMEQLESLLTPVHTYMSLIDQVQPHVQLVEQMQSNLQPVQSYTEQAKQQMQPEQPIMQQVEQVQPHVQLVDQMQPEQPIMQQVEQVQLPVQLVDLMQPSVQPLQSYMEQAEQQMQPHVQQEQRYIQHVGQIQPHEQPVQSSYMDQVEQMPPYEQQVQPVSPEQNELVQQEVQPVRHITLSEPKPVEVGRPKLLEKRKYTRRGQTKPYSRYQVQVQPQVPNLPMQQPECFSYPSMMAGGHLIHQQPYNCMPPMFNNFMPGQPMCAYPHGPVYGCPQQPYILPQVYCPHQQQGYGSGCMAGYIDPGQLNNVYGVYRPA